MQVDIILTVDVTSGTVINFDEIWELNKLKTDAYIDWGDGSEFDTSDTRTHTYTEAFNGEIKLCGYGVVHSKYPGNYWDENTTKNSIKSVNFVTPQVIERVNILFATCKNLTSVTGIIFLTETNSMQMNALFYGCNSLTSLKGLTIYWNSSTLKSLSGLFQNCSNVTDETVRQLKIVNLNPDKITSYQAAFANTNITKVNNKLVGTKTMEFSQAFEGTPITYIPEGILDNCKGGSRTFLNSQVSSIHPNVTLKNLIKGNGMFAGCPLSYNYSKQLYDTLTPVPEGETVTKPSNMNDNYNYVITFAYVDGEEEYIAEAFGISENNPDTTQPWLGDKGIPLSIHGEYWLSPKGWYVSFSDN